MCSGLGNHARAKRLPLRHPSLTQASEEGGFEQGAGFRHPEIFSGPQPGDTGVPITPVQSPSFGEFLIGPFNLVLKSIS